MQLSMLIAGLLLVVVPPMDQNSRVHDYAGLLSAEQRQSLENLSRDVEQQTTAEIVVVTVPSLDGETVEAYANELFNSWLIGQRDANNGVLLLVAPRERRMKFEVGFGLDSVLTDALTGKIADTYIVPRFKENDYAAGIIAGTKQIARTLQANPQAARGIPGSTPFLMQNPREEALAATTAVGVLAAVLAVLAFLFAARRLYSTTTFVVVSALTLGVLAIGAYFIWRAPKPQQPLALFGGAGAAAIAAWGFNFAKFRRFGPHGCSKCGTHLELLSEQDDDPKLTSVQRLEEKIGSVDYDVWICPACLNNDTERYIKAFSGFSDCPACHARTYKEDAQKVITAATTLGAGRARVDGRCVSCNHKTVRYVVLPRIVQTSSSSSGGSFGGGGGGGGGGGFGGGMSGGGGASRGW